MVDEDRERKDILRSSISNTYRIPICKPTNSSFYRTDNCSQSRSTPKERIVNLAERLVH